MFPTAAESSGAYRRFSEATTALLQSAGTDHQWARTLPAVLTAAGLIGVGAEADVDICRGGSAMAECRQLSLAQLRGVLLQNGLITEAEFDNGAACLSDPNHWLRLQPGGKSHLYNNRERSNVDRYVDLHDAWRATPLISVARGRTSMGVMA